VRAITIGDKAHAMLPAFQRKADRAIDLLSSLVERGFKMGVSFSTGKDSTVTLDLVRRVYPGVPAAFFSSGIETEYDQCFELLKNHHPDVDVFESYRTLADLCRDFGYWGHEPEKFADEVDWFAFLVGEPSVRFVRKYKFDVTVMGLRAQESAGRRLSRKVRGYFYPVKFEYLDGVQHHHCTPIVDWKDEDVWAYIASRDLPYNKIYDKMAEIGVPRKHWRVSILLGEVASNLGRYSTLKRIAPEKFNQLSIHFPSIRRMI